MARKRAASQTTSTAAAQHATATDSVSQTAVLNRVPQRLDPLLVSDPAVQRQLLPTRQMAASQIHLGVTQIAATLTAMKTELARPTLPDQLIGTLVQPNGNGAARVQLQFDPNSVRGAASGQYRTVTTLTDDAGHFQLLLPHGLPGADLVLTAHGANANRQLAIAFSRIAANGLVGSLVLTETLIPLPVSIIASLNALVSATAPSPAAAGGAAPAARPKVTLGEDGPCKISYEASICVDSFPYGVFFRLVEPRTSIVNVARRIPMAGVAGKFWYTAMYQNATSQPATNLAYVDRVPVDQPISVDGFRDQIIGLSSNGTIADGETVPMAGTLGLGYVLRLSQRWKLEGLALGNLVYSLPLAPGEQQEVAIFERSDTSAVVESETFSEQAAQAQSAVSDTSTLATFNSAISQMQKGGSSTTSSAANAGVAVGGILGFFGVSGGAGASTSGGSSSSYLSGQTDSAQSAAEQTHSAVANQASARVSAARSSMRMASATESESVVTKVITNHNHTRALTMQYWEVLRHYNVETCIEGVTLTCLVPLQVVRFLPTGQPLTVQDASYFAASTGILGIGVNSVRQIVLKRYSSLIKHIDVLLRAVPRNFQQGLILLRQFVSDPTVVVETYGGLAEDVIQFKLSGTFLPCEYILISAVTSSNTRVGPVQMSGAITPIPPNKFSSKDDLLAYLRTQRMGGPVTLNGNLALPPSMNRTDIIGFEIRRGFNQVDATLLPTEIQALSTMKDLFGGGGTPWMAAAIQSMVGQESSGLVGTTIHLQPSELESALGGPRLQSFAASILEYDANGVVVPGGSGTARGETYANDTLNGVELPSQPYPLPAQRVGPVLRFNQILEMERTLQHVVGQTVDYSKAIWASMTAEERAILLEGYTIGVPPGGVADATQMIPLLNCVTNEVLGFFGNSMVMPFIIPDTVALSTGVTSAEIQDTLTNFHKCAFRAPCTCVTLPTKGVLGEAVLGHCPSAEKIDLTRFWNWSDAPADTAPAISAITLPTTSPSIAGSLTAPNSLTTLTPLINNIVSAPVPGAGLAQTLAGTAIPTLNPALTGAAQLATQIAGDQTSASSARADAVKQSGDLSKLVLATAGNIVGAQTGNPTAGSSALSSLTGNAQPTAPAAAKAVTATSVSLTSTPAVPTLNTDAQFTAKVLPAEADQTVTWSCTPTTGASIGNMTGKFNASAAGQYTVTATTKDGAHSGSLTFTV